MTTRRRKRKPIKATAQELARALAPHVPGGFFAIVKREGEPAEPKRSGPPSVVQIPKRASLH